MEIFMDISGKVADQAFFSLNALFLRGTL